MPDAPNPVPKSAPKTILKPGNQGEVVEAIADALAGKVPLELTGAASKQALGHPVMAECRLDLSDLRGINFYEPDELVISAKPGTPLTEIEAALAEQGQQLGFEPMDAGPLLGGVAGSGTIGGVFACNLAGPRRIKAGAARDHLLGFNAVSGRAEAFKSGGRVVKNVTGYDLSKLVCGSYGTLAALTEVTFKTVPAPEKTWTILLLGQDEAAATRAMARAMNSAHEVAGAAHLPPAVAAKSAVSYVKEAGCGVTALRLEGFGPSVEERCRALRGDLSEFGPLEELHSHNSHIFWREVRDVTAFADAPDTDTAARVVWKISVAPADGHRLLADIADESTGAVHAIHDWSGGLIWLSMPPSPDAGHKIIRTALAVYGGHATLFRAPAETRAKIPVFQPQPEALAALSARIKTGFDPERILNPGRMVAELRGGA